MIHCEFKVLQYNDNNTEEEQYLLKKAKESLIRTMYNYERDFIKTQMKENNAYIYLLFSTRGNNIYVIFVMQSHHIKKKWIRCIKLLYFMF